MRGTDYVSIKPQSHPIPPEPEMVIRDIKSLIKNNTKFKSKQKTLKIISLQYSFHKRHFLFPFSYHLYH